MNKSAWRRFSKKSLEERLEVIAQLGLLNPEEMQALANNQTLSPLVANQMSENVIGTFGLPFSVLPELYVDGKTYHVPMVTEEPSVVAAASYAASLFNRSGGFTTEIHNRLMIGQIALYDCNDMNKAQAALLQAKDDLLAQANAAYPSIVKRGGGARDIVVKPVGDGETFLCLYLYVDTQEAMGANMLNTMLEAIKPTVEAIANAPALMSILSNYATESLVTAKTQLDLKLLSRNPQEARAIARKIALASQLSQEDPYRAATHNKGIFNGIDALLIATGNDWRAIEAGSHAYASKQGRYRGLSTWTFHENEGMLEGEITLPLPLATKGGSIGLNLTVVTAHQLLDKPNARELMSITASLGLAQNFAALRALVSEGIQKGHMNLQLRSLALLAGAKEEELDQLLTQLKQEKIQNLDTAKRLLERVRKIRL